MSKNSNKQRYQALLEYLAFQKKFQKPKPIVLDTKSGNKILLHND